MAAGMAEDTTLSLDEVVVTATRTEEDIDKISSNVTVITRRTSRINRYDGQDLLRNEAASLSGICMAQGQNPQST